MSNIKVTQTNGNSRNKIKGSRLTFTKNGKKIDSFVIPTHNAKGYVKQHPTGQYAKRYRENMKK